MPRLFVEAIRGYLSSPDDLTLGDSLLRLTQALPLKTVHASVALEEGSDLLLI